MRVLTVMLLLSAALPCAAAPAVAQPPTVAPPARTAGEPDVRESVIEDKGSRIEELRVRGTTQRIVVTPKVGTSQSYEIITGDGSRDLSDNAALTRGATGKRVWHVLSF